MILKTEDFNPVLLKASYFDGYTLKPYYSKPYYKMKDRMVYDYEIEYYIKSDGGVIIDDEFVSFNAGDIGIRKPGQKVCGVGPYECYFVALDFIGNHHKCEQYVLGTQEGKQPCFENTILSNLPQKISANEAKYAGLLMNKLYKISLYKTDIDQLTIKANILLLIKELFEICYQNEQSLKNNPMAIRKIIEYINSHYSSEISISELIKMSGFSKAYFHKLFQQYTGTTPNQFIIRLRIEKAKYLLSISTSDVGEIAYHCGYYDSVYFTYVFKKNTGLTPSEYRKKSQ